MKTYDVTVTIRIEKESEQKAMDVVHSVLIELEGEDFYKGYSDMRAEEVTK